MNSRERVLAQIAGEPVDHLPLMPITMMFAGDRAGIRYGDYCRDHRKLAEAQLRVAEDFGFDYVSAISDPAREAADCGARIEWFADQPPAIIEEEALLADKTVLARLRVPDPQGGGRLTDRVQGVALLKEKVGGDKIVEGWVEGPMAQGADLRGINTIMLDFYDDETFVRELFEFVLAMELAFARAQIAAGADLIGVGDAAASLVGPEIYHEFVLPYEKRLVEGIQAAGGRVRLHICGRTNAILKGMGSLGCEIVDLDYFADLSKARAEMGPGQVLLGNLEPVGVLRNQSPAQISAAVAACHRAAGPRYIVGAGCEIVRDTPEANVRVLSDYARQNRA